MKFVKPPLGVRPRFLWEEEHPEPTVLELLERYTEVADALYGYRMAGCEPPEKWLVELGIA